MNDIDIKLCTPKRHQNVNNNNICEKK